MRLDAEAELALGDVLQILVDCELEGLAGRWWALDAAERAAARVRLDEHLPVEALDQVVVGGFDAAEADAVDADVAEQVGRELLVRIEAAVLLHEPDAVEVERGHTPCLIGRGLPAHVGKCAVAVEARGEGALLRRRAVFQRTAQRDGRGLGIVNLGGHHVDRVRVHAERQHAAVPVDDVAALGRGVDGPGLLALGPRGQLIVLHDLQVDEPGLDDGRPEQEHTGRDDDPSLQRGAPVDRLGLHASRSYASALPVPTAA